MEPPAPGGGTAPFLQKTYDMVDDSSTDAIVSWGSKRDTFVVWDHLEFSRILLPTYFKHNNFASFIRQLNTYGFRKDDPEKWVFRNEDFVKDERHRLKNIHRKKSTHGPSNPAGGVDSERAALEEEIRRLSTERDRLQDEFHRPWQPEIGCGLGEMESKLESMEQRQERLANFLHRAVKNPTFVERLVALVNVASTPKKRRSLSWGGLDGSSEHLDDSCSNDGHDFYNKLKLEFCPAFSDGDLVLGGGECEGSPQRVVVEGHTGIECHLFLPEDVELEDTSASLCQKRSSCLSWCPSNDDEEAQDISRLLKLTLASSPLQFSEIQIADRILKSTDQNVEEVVCLGSKNMGKEDRVERNIMEQDSPGYKDADTSTTNNQPNAPFWAQYLTERPGSSENEEVGSCLRSSNQEDRMQVTSNQEDRMQVGETWIKRDGMKAMKL